MTNKEYSYEIMLGPNKIITLETGTLAQLADGSAVVRSGDTVLLATAVADKSPKEDLGFFPLTVNYQEKYYANGRIPGGYLKREGQLAEHEVIISRQTDRAIRPLFDKNFRCETHINLMLLSGNAKELPDTLACLAASTALMTSNIPFNGPVSAVRVVKAPQGYIVNPTADELQNVTLDIVVSGTRENIMMVEGEMDEVDEDEIVEAIAFAQKFIIHLCAGQQAFIQNLESKPKWITDTKAEDPVLKDMIALWAYTKLFNITLQEELSPVQKKEHYRQIKEAFIQQLTENTRKEAALLVARYFEETIRQVQRDAIVHKNTRLDGRVQTQIRPIWGKAGYLPAIHGSAVFTRGETQALATVTLGSKKDEQLVSTALNEMSSKFILHYNFPSFSTGEARANRGVSRREIGHGHLAARSLKRVLPVDPSFPYTIRIVSEILQSNGSSSMATVCAGSMALMDAGIPVRSSIAGIAMGLIRESERYMILSDISGDEDHIGDMDFKITGTRKGICACQMDIKTAGLDGLMMSLAFAQARQGLNHILDEMDKVILAPKESVKSNVSKVSSLRVPKKSIGLIIGTGGKNIQSLQKKTNTVISIEDGEQHAKVEIAGNTTADVEAAALAIRELIQEPKTGKSYIGTVKTILPFGAIIEIFPGKTGLLYNSEIAGEPVADASSHLSVGEKLEVHVLLIDAETGNTRLSRKASLSASRQ